MQSGPEFSVSKTFHAAICVIRLAGELDLNTSPLFREVLWADSTNHPMVVVDLTKVSLVDSTGLSTLVMALRRLRKGGGDLSLVGLQPQVKEVFDNAGLSEVFALYYDLKDAVYASEAAASGM
jgi:anti-sigma B factor antagonist